MSGIVVQTIARAGSISAAARIIGLTQPAITEALARLEDRLGLALFDRIPSGMLPTEAGQLLAARADAARPRQHGERQDRDQPDKEQHRGAGEREREWRDHDTVRTARCNI